MPVKSTKRVIFLLFCLLVMQGVKGQVTIFNETMGSGGSNGAPIATWEANNYFDNDSYTMSGTGDMRNTSVSSGYTGASGTWNVMLNASTEYFQIADIDCSSYSSIVISIGIRKGTTAENGSTLAIQVSSDGTNWTNLSYSLPTGTGTATWHLVTPTGSIPSASNLRIKFTSSSAVEFRIDDIIVKGNIASCTAPTTQVQNITGTASGAYSMVVNWSNGNGDGRIIKINTSNSFTNPTDGVDNPGNATYSGSGEQLVYNGSGSSVTVSGLEPCVTYWVRAYEYNCSGSSIKYNITTAANNPASVSITTVGGGTTTLASENFEAATNWNYTHVATIVGTGGDGVSSLTIKNSPFGFSNSKALVKSHTTNNLNSELLSVEEITFNNVIIPSGSSNIQFSFRLASLDSLGTLMKINGAGHDTKDSIKLRINLNNTTWQTCFVQKGFSDKLFSYLPEVQIPLNWNQNIIFSDPNNGYNIFAHP